MRGAPNQQLPKSAKRENAHGRRKSNPQRPGLLVTQSPDSTMQTTAMSVPNNAASIQLPNPLNLDYLPDVIRMPHPNVGDFMDCENLLMQMESSMASIPPGTENDNERSCRSYSPYTTRLPESSPTAVNHNLDQTQAHHCKSHSTSALHENQMALPNAPPLVPDPRFHLPSRCCSDDSGHVVKQNSDQGPAAYGTRDQVSSVPTCYAARAECPSISRYTPDTHAAPSHGTANCSHRAFESGTDRADLATLQLRLEKALISIEEAGFASIEDLVTDYYTRQFSKDTTLAAAQSYSRSRRLRHLLHALHENTRTWSEREVTGYQESVIRAAEEILRNEIQKQVSKSRQKRPPDVTKASGYSHSFAHGHSLSLPNYSLPLSPSMPSRRSPEMETLLEKIRRNALASTFTQDIPRLQETVICPEYFFVALTVSVMPPSAFLTTRSI
ncbi:uncharacterized protein ATNIH1004_006754 [Aspergillus tanneri]|uniref:Uncharacterized protein n=1 Tax=Aspergillus tanneri TaxID=1220188 RepID=A0A5M9MED3_9EURO|nr:uncharacterized protein ATNIH1004_006754 [Aspergillus tanneri]KAA8645335.1 hypothetical protein ATNIH1004_006754 [Aspergillus tanneri]